MNFAPITQELLLTMKPGDQIVAPEKAWKPNKIAGEILALFNVPIEVELVSSDLTIKIPALIIQRTAFNDKHERLTAPEHYKWSRNVVKWLRLTPKGFSLFFTKGQGDATNYTKGIMSNLRKSNLKAKQLSATVFDGNKRYKGVFLWLTE